jgi:hypothetical protein
MKCLSARALRAGYAPVNASRRRCRGYRLAVPRFPYHSWARDVCCRAPLRDDAGRSAVRPAVAGDAEPNSGPVCPSGGAVHHQKTVCCTGTTVIRTRKPFNLSVFRPFLAFQQPEVCIIRVSGPVRCDPPPRCCRAGDRQATAHLMSLVYNELRKSTATRMAAQAPGEGVTGRREI